MTWRADEIFAPACPEVLRAVREDARLSPFAYHVTSPLDHAWNTPEFAHELPTEGLIVIRPVCDAVLAESPAWYDEPMLDSCSWTGHAVPETLAEFEKLAASGSLEVEAQPPPALLGYLKELAAKTRSTFIFYSCSTWAGLVDHEYAWIFGDSELAILTLPGEAPGQPEPLGVLEPGKPLRFESGNALVSALKFLPLELPTPYFALHEREFPWERYKLA